MSLLLGLVLILWGEPGLGLEKDVGFTLEGGIDHFALTTNMVYIATEEKLYQLDHDLTLVHSLTLRGILKEGKNMEETQFYRVSEDTGLNATFTVNVLLPFVTNQSLIICGVIDNGCGYCEVLDLNNISNILYSENIQVGPLRHNSASVAMLVNVEKSSTQSDTYILTAVQRKEGESDKCSTNYGTVNLYNTDDKQSGGIFSVTDYQGTPFIKRVRDVEFVDGFQISSTIYLLSNVQSGSRNKVRLIWLKGKTSKTETLRSLRGATLAISDKTSRLVASSVIPGGPPVLWSGVFSVDRGRTDTELVVFDISPDLTVKMNSDPDFCSGTDSCTGSEPKPKTLKPEAVLLKQKSMTSVLAVRQKAWMVFYMGTADGQLIKLAVDKNYHTTCFTVLYRANDNRPVFPKIHLDRVDHTHVYVALGNQMKRVPVSTCSTYTKRQQCLSAQDPYCVWCPSKNSCTFEDDCTGSDWLSIPEDLQHKTVSNKVEKTNTSQLKLIVQTHVTMSSTDLSNFACQFVGIYGEMCKRNSPRPQFPQCTCILANKTIPAEGLIINIRFRLGTMSLTEKLKLNNCSGIRGSPTSHFCQQCIKSGCGWRKNSCSWANKGVGNDSVCQTIKSKMNFARPEISSITPSVVSFHGRNHAVLSGHNLSDVTRVRLQRGTACTTQESSVWNNTGVNLKFHIPSTDHKGVVTVCVVLPDGSCHGKSEVTYQSSPSCIKTEPSSTWYSGRRIITLIGLHLDFVEGIIHSHDPQEVRFPTNSNSQTLTYETAAAENTQQSFISSVSLRVGNETLVCSTNFKYLPDPEFITFTSTRAEEDVLITLKKKMDELEMTAAELSVWGLHNGKQFPCIMTNKKNSDSTELFNCEIKNLPDSSLIQHLMIKYGNKTVTLGSPSLLDQVLLILRSLLICCVSVVTVMICRWQKKHYSCSGSSRPKCRTADLDFK